MPNNRRIGARRAEMPKSKTFLAQKMRAEPTRAERALWAFLSDRQQGGIKFRRQAPMWGYIADFYAPSVRLCIEVDGGYHITRVGADAKRDADLARHGIRTMRFTNERVMRETDAVLAEINAAIDAAGPTPRQRERQARNQECPRAA